MNDGELKRARKIVSKYIMHKIWPEEEVYKEELFLIDPVSNMSVLEISATSLKHKRRLLEAVLIDLLNDYLTCDKCGTTDCYVHDNIVPCLGLCANDRRGRQKSINTVA